MLVFYREEHVHHSHVLAEDRYLALIFIGNLIVILILVILTGIFLHNRGGRFLLGKQGQRNQCDRKDE